MKRIIATFALTAAAALVLGGCSSSDSDTDTSIPAAGLGATQTVKGDGWSADVTVSDLIVREMDYYGDIKPENQYRAAVLVESTEGETPMSSNIFEAVAEDGTTLNLSIGGEYDDINTSGDVPAGYERAGMVTWTGAPGITIKEISFIPDGVLPAATWTVTGAPTPAPPSRMPNHDEVVATKTAEPAAPTASATTSEPSPSVGVKPGAVATEVDAAPSMSDAEIRRGCSELRVVMEEKNLSDPRLLLALMQNGEDWKAAAPGEQASAIKAIEMMERGEC